jgi:hypothetical protein
MCVCILLILLIYRPLTKTLTLKQGLNKIYRRPLLWTKLLHFIPTDQIKLDSLMLKFHIHHAESKLLSDLRK